MAKVNMNMMTLAKKCKAGGAGTKFWIGAVDLDGNIVEVHKYEEAERCDFHPDFYFTEEVLLAVERMKMTFFWMNKPGVIDADMPICNELMREINRQLR